MALVSAVMPVYNARRYLRGAVESVIAQSFTDWELIAVDDGSKDDSLAILKEYAERDGRVKVMSRANTGIVGALNDGLKAATGELIARMDADDLALPGRFGKQVAFLKEHRDHVLVGSQVMLIDSDDADLCPKQDTEYSHEAIDKAHLAGRWPLVHPSVMMRREAVERVGGYRDKYQWLEDLDLFLRLAEVGKLASVPEVLLRYRLHTGSVCHTREGEQAQIRPELEAEVYARRGIERPADGQGKGREPSPASAGERFRLWGWWALMGGNVSTARRYAMRTLRADPWARETWRLMYCAARGR
jgi:glycosyltransferase involved in cell wall biosynthesis